jgi:hypothetical protein
LEFILNKIDTDMRKKLQEEIEISKIHSGKKITGKKDLKDEKNSNEREKNNKQKKIMRYVTIDGVKYEHKSMSIKAEKIENTYEDNSKGRILDAKK